MVTPSPGFTIGGIASGLDTDGIINSLIQLERIPINRMAAQRRSVEAKNDAWTDITTKVSAMRDAVDALRLGDGLDTATATSSLPDTVGVTVTGPAVPAAVQITVGQLATTHQVTTTTGLADASTTVGAGSLTIDAGGTLHTVNTTADTTLADLAGSIRSLDAGVEAVVLKVADGDHRLVVTSSTSGASGQFSLTTAGLAIGDEQLLTDGVDAELQLGTGLNALAVTRSTNTVSDLVDGLEIQLAATSPTPVTIDIARDIETVTENIAAVFDAASDVLAEIDLHTSYDAASETASPLTGDAMARTLDSRLNAMLSTVSATFGGTLAEGSPISFLRTGLLEVDREQLAEALRSDFDGVRDSLEGTFLSDDSRTTPLSTSSATVPGSYAVVVTSTAAAASVTGSAYSAPLVDAGFDIDAAGIPVAVTVTAGSDLAAALVQVNAALTGAGVTDLVASDGGGAITLATTTASAASTFTVTNDLLWGLDGTRTGSDGAATIGGQPTTILDSTFTATAGDPDGLTVAVDMTGIDTSSGPVAVGSVTFADGLLITLDSFLDDAEGVDGFIARARAEHDARIEDINDQIAAMELRVARREETLRRQYTAMEQALARIQDGASFLNSLLTPPAQGTTT